MQFFSLYESYFKQSLTNTQVQTLKILVWLITVQKTVKIERLAACFPLPVKYENLRKHIQRFLTLCSLSFPLFWFQIITMIINGHFIKKSGYQNYICRLTKLRIKDRRDSNFWVGILNMDIITQQKVMAGYSAQCLRPLLAYQTRAVGGIQNYYSLEEKPAGSFE